MQGFASYREAADAAVAYDREHGDGVERYHVNPNKCGGHKVTVQRPGDPDWRIRWIAAAPAKD